MEDFNADEMIDRAGCRRQICQLKMK